MCAGFKVAKRRRDWLFGRWTAKHLIQAYLALTHGQSSPLDQIEILAGEHGAPYARLGTRLPVSLSISHSGLESFCAVCDQDVGHVGADIEQVEAREFSFVRTFFTPAENAAVEAASPQDRDRLITALWSAKEAVLKALRLGLRVDTRQVSIEVRGISPDWQPAGTELDPLLLSASSQITAWVQVQPSRVLSLALLH